MSHGGFGIAFQHSLCGIRLLTVPAPHFTNHLGVSVVAQKNSRCVFPSQTAVWMVFVLVFDPVANQ
jgi:hypothetical protein